MMRARARAQVVVALMHAKKLTREQYAMNHPAGAHARARCAAVAGLF